MKRIKLIKPVKKKFKSMGLPLPKTIFIKEILCPIDSYPIEFRVSSGILTGKEVGWANGKCINCGLSIYGIINLEHLDG